MVWQCGEYGDNKITCYINVVRRVVSKMITIITCYINVVRRVVSKMITIITCYINVVRQCGEYDDNNY